MAVSDPSYHQPSYRGEVSERLKGAFSTCGRENAAIRNASLWWYRTLRIINPHIEERCPSG